MVGLEDMFTMERWVVGMGQWRMWQTAGWACPWDVEGSRSGPMKEAAQVRSALPSKIRTQEGAYTTRHLHMLASPPGLIGPVEAIPLTSIPRPHNPHGPDNKSVPLLLSNPPRPVDPPPLHRKQVGGGPQHRHPPRAGRHRRLRQVLLLGDGVQRGQGQPLSRPAMGEGA